jgi:hypothetical protein
MSLFEFNALFTEDAEATLERAFQEQQPRRRRRQATQRRPKVNYATPEHAGEPHRGRITEEEKQLVRDNLASVNERLITDGHRPITPDDPELAERYGLTLSEPTAEE